MAGGQLFPTLKVVEIEPIGIAEDAFVHLVTAVDKQSR
jgi:hypothetical protein